MILGTVQLGMDYGINNQIGKPTRNQAYEILDYAYEHKVGRLDTASAYGDSEEIIGTFAKKSGKYFEVSTKLPIKLENDAEYLIDTSLYKLNHKCLDIIYLHRFEQVKDDNLMMQLQELKKKKKIKRVGVSIYEPLELEYLIKYKKEVVDVVQLPFNIADCWRWKKDGLLQRGKELFCIYARSVYLQGLLVAEITSNNLQKINIEVYRKLAENKGISIQELAVAYVKNETTITDFLIGCESIVQLQENIKCVETNISFSDQEKEMLLKESKRIPQFVIDPRKWKN